MPKTEVIFEGEKYTGEVLAAAERAILFDQLRRNFVGKRSFYEHLINDHLESVEAALTIAKDRLGAPFGGVSAGDGEVGMQKIRPGHILRTTASTETCANTWSFSFTAAGDYYVGYSTNNTTAINIDKEALVLVLGVMFTQGAQPVVEEMLIQVGGTTYPVQVLRDAWAADNEFKVRGVPIRPILLVPKATTLWQPYSIVAETQELVLLGITFGMGRYLRNASYSSVSL